MLEILGSMTLVKDLFLYECILYLSVLAWILLAYLLTECFPIFQRVSIIELAARIVFTVIVVKVILYLMMLFIWSLSRCLNDLFGLLLFAWHLYLDFYLVHELTPEIRQATTTISLLT